MKVIIIFCISIYSTFEWLCLTVFFIFMAYGGKCNGYITLSFFQFPKLQSKTLCLTNKTCFLNAVSWGCYSRTWSDPWVLSYTFNSPGHLPSSQINAASVRGALMLLLSSDALGLVLWWANPLRRSEPFKGQRVRDVLAVFVWMWGQKEWKKREGGEGKVQTLLLRNVFVSRRIAALWKKTLCWGGSPKEARPP